MHEWIFKKTQRGTILGRRNIALITFQHSPINVAAWKENKGNL